MKYLSFHLLGWFVMCLPVVLQAQDTVHKAIWVPKGNLYPIIRLDYKENQVSGAVYAMYENGRWQNQAIGLFSLGFSKSIIRWMQTPVRASEIGLELTLFPQFLFEQPFERFQANFFNIDFQIGVHYTYMAGDWRFRGRIYHISTHLGDDYIFRYDIETFIDNPRIYEAVDGSVAWEKDPWLVYGCVGMIFHSAYERFPLLIQAGAQCESPLGNKEWLGWITGVDIRMEQEQAFRPGIHVGAGLVLGRNRRLPIVIMADYYNGYLPYSLYDMWLVQWVGLSAYIRLF